MAAETEQERARRRYQRTLFDGVADLYDASRPGYPASIVEFAAATAGLGAGADVLEVGCGTGQLTERLADLGFSLTAIDIGPSMIAAARNRLPAVCFRVAPFEDFAAADASFDLIISGAAFHWIDPEVKYRKAAELLRPGGWLAVLHGDERYDDPFGTVLHQSWAARGDADTGAWTQHRPDAGSFTGSGLFGQPVQYTQTARFVRAADTVIGVENTRAISLSWPEGVRQAFTEEIRQHLRAHPEVHVTQQTTLTMARTTRGS
jgi:ubiquinone/menaquinone biosynthesis C-methylase UbiE